MRTTMWRGMRTHAGAAALVLSLLAGCGGGGSDSAAPAPVPVVNAAPLPTLTLSGQVAVGADAADVSTFTGSNVVLDAGASKDPDGDPVSHTWTLVSKPAGSSVVVPAAPASQLAFRPDLAGTYVLGLRVTDSRGAFAERQATIVVRQNAAPNMTLSMSASYSAVPTVLPARSVTVGAIVLLDGNGSFDADGDAVTTVWDLVERPVASRTSLTIGSGTARLVTDVVGLYKVRARGTDPSGAYSETVYPIQALGNAPQTVVLGTVTNVTADAGSATVQAAVGYLVGLSSATSRDPDGGTLSHAWTLVSKPAASAATLSSATGAFSQLTPDVLGDYVVKVVATNPNGASSSYQTTVSVKNQRPVADITSNATPIALPAGPTLRMPPNTTLTLRGTTSLDADGDALTYTWTLDTRPAASTAALSATTGSTVQLTTDIAGSYQVRLRVTDAAGAYSEKLLNIESGNAAPVAATDKSRVSVLAGNAVTASAALSHDEDGDTLTYSWAIDARPAGSSATLAAPNTAQLAFTPDVAGTYVASVTVSDGKSASIAYLTIRALGSITSNLALPFVPLEWRYSRGLDRFVAVATNPNALHIVDPFTGTMRQVSLPLGVKAFSLSADGKLAAVLHEGVVSLVDIDSATLLRSSATGGSQTDAFVTNAGLIYMVGQTGGQWVSPSVYVLNGRTGADLSATGSYGFGYFYGTLRGIFAASKNKGFVISNGLSPADISYFTLDGSGAVSAVGDSPYHGDYAMNAPFYLSSNEDLLFTSNGNYFRTDTLRYGGRLPVSDAIMSMSHSGTADEAIVMTGNAGYSYPYTPSYTSSYQRFTGALFFPDTAITLPSIGGQQSYGIGIFHSANDNHVALVQTGSAVPNATGIKYYLVTR
ncbi:MAG: PKD domain-containing protein [Telluria sp.]